VRHPLFIHPPEEPTTMIIIENVCFIFYQVISRGTVLELKNSEDFSSYSGGHMSRGGI
jgi:hypothetical protein